MWYLWDFRYIFISGTLITLLISLISLILGFIIGVLSCVFRISNIKFLKIFSNIYVEIIRDTPLLIQLSIIAFGLPMIGLKFPNIFGLGSEFTIGVVALSLNSGAYISEIMRSGIQSVDIGQMEASRSLGFGYYDSLKYVIIPQAIKNILPALANEFVSLVKESSIVSFISTRDLMFIANSVKNSTFRPFSPYILAGFIYFIITYSISKLVRRLEKKMTPTL